MTKATSSTSMHLRTLSRAARLVSPYAARYMTMSAAAAPPATKREGNISDAFASLSGQACAPLPDRFRELKLDLVRGHEEAIVASWERLLGELRHENAIVRSVGSAVVPEVGYGELDAGLERLKADITKRGVVVVRGVIPEAEARAYKTELEDYIRKNPHTRGESSYSLLCHLCECVHCS